MIYFDNGATSFPKPDSVRRSMNECISRFCGNPGRSGHLMSLKTGEAVYDTRKKLASLFNGPGPEHVIFTKNTTEALNLGIKGLLKNGDHVITTSMEHNSVLRPITYLESMGVENTVIWGDEKGKISAKNIESAITPRTKLIVATFSSNVCGSRLPIGEIGEIGRRRNILFMVDGAQGAGSCQIDMKKNHIDLLAFPGHKGLLGPQGTGGLIYTERCKPEVFLHGGTGTESKSIAHPEEPPEALEAGTLNALGIVGLGRGIEFLEKIGISEVERYERDLISVLEEAFKNMKKVKVYGDRLDNRTGILLFNVEGVSAENVTSYLSQNFGICVRGGFHCAGLAHKTIGTWDTGGVRVSVGPFNTFKEIYKLVEAVNKITIDMSV